MRLISLGAVLMAAAITTACERLPGPVNEAKRAVRSSLFDPDSAKFESVAVNAQSKAVCGKVNAKNRMGAYVGMTPFVYESPGLLTVVEEPPSERDFERYFEALQFRDEEDYLKLRQACTSRHEWATKCLQDESPSPNRYCALINKGASFTEVYKAAEPNLNRY